MFPPIPSALPWGVYCSIVSQQGAASAADDGPVNNEGPDEDHFSPRAEYPASPEGSPAVLVEMVRVDVAEPYESLGPVNNEEYEAVWT